MTYALCLTKAKKSELANRFRHQIIEDSSLNGIERFNDFLDDLFNKSSINNKNFKEMLEILIVSGMDFSYFCEESNYLNVNVVKKYDFSSVCGLVWTTNFIAYRCKDCAISPCMSICPTCFKGGPHEDEKHDYNMFRSQAGGACDCGDPNVMKQEGFCKNHDDKQNNLPIPPKELTILLSILAPFMATKILAFFREYCQENGEFDIQTHLPLCFSYIEILSKYINVAGPIKRIISQSFIESQVYNEFVRDFSYKSRRKGVEESSFANYRSIFQETQNKYIQACHKLGTDPKGIQMFQFIDVHEKESVNFFSHKNVLDELMMWIFLTELPQPLVTFVLQMLNVVIPDTDFKKHFCESFVKNYACLPRILMRCTEPEVVSSRLFHISVQLFSNESLSYSMVMGPGNLLRLSLNSLNLLILPILKPQSSNDKHYQNLHVAVDCSHKIMQSHCYWPIVSDFVTLLSHSSISKSFLVSDIQLIALWTHILYSFQGMNLNKKERLEHIEYEPKTYYVAFSSEIEVCTSTLQALLSHLKDFDSSQNENTKIINLNDFKYLLRHIMLNLQDWFEVIGMEENEINGDEVTFHLPMHRYLSIIISSGFKMKCDGLTCKDLIHIFSTIHPFRHVAANEIIAGLWVRNGLQIKGQVMTYTQNTFNTAMYYPDIFILQICACLMPYENFVEILLRNFGINEMLPLWKNRVTSNEVNYKMIEGMLVLLLFVITFKDFYTKDQFYGMDKNIVELLTKTNYASNPILYSHLLDMIPDRSTYSVDSDKSSQNTRHFATFIQNVAEYKPPDLEMTGGEISQGYYLPKDLVWETDLYDPLRIMATDLTRKDFQISFDNYKLFLKRRFKDYFTQKFVDNVWPPFLMPEFGGSKQETNSSAGEQLFNSMLPLLIRSEKLDFLILNILLSYLCNKKECPDTLFQLALYFLQLKLKVPATTEEQFYRLEDQGLTFDLDGLNKTCKLQDVLEQQGENNNNNISLKRSISPEKKSSTYLSKTRNIHDQSSLTSLTHFRFTPQKFKECYFKDYSTRLEIDLKKVVVNLPNDHELLYSSNSSNMTKLRTKLLDKFSHLCHDGGPVPPPSNLLGIGAGEKFLKSSLLSRMSAFNKYSNEISIYNCLAIIYERDFASNDDPLKPIPQTLNVMDGKMYLKSILKQIEILKDFEGDSYSTATTHSIPSSSTVNKKISPNYDEDGTNKKKKAKERQKKLLNSYASKQKKFIQHIDKNKELYYPSQLPSPPNLLIKNVEFNETCSICGNVITIQQTKQNKTEIAGLVCRIRVINSIHKYLCGHSRVPDLVKMSDKLLSPNSADAASKQNLKEDSPPLPVERLTFGEFNSSFNDRLKKDNIVPQKWITFVRNGATRFPVRHLTTCGHIFHISCYKSYMESLQRQNPSFNPSTLGEYECPVCRRISNQFLPLNPTILFRCPPPNSSNEEEYGEEFPSPLLHSLIKSPKNSDIFENQKDEKVLSDAVSDILSKFDSTLSDNKDKIDFSYFDNSPKNFPNYREDKMIDDLLEPSFDLQQCTSILRDNIEMHLANIDVYKKGGGYKSYELSFYQNISLASLIDRSRVLLCNSLRDVNSYIQVSSLNNNDPQNALQTYFEEYKHFFELFNTFGSQSNHVFENAMISKELFMIVSLLSDSYTLLSNYIILFGKSLNSNYYLFKNICNNFQILVLQSLFPYIRKMDLIEEKEIVLLNENQFLLLSAPPDCFEFKCLQKIVKKIISCMGIELKFSSTMPSFLTGFPENVVSFVMFARVLNIFDPEHFSNPAWKNKIKEFCQFFKESKHNYVTRIKEKSEIPSTFSNTNKELLYYDIMGNEKSKIHHFLHFFHDAENAASSSSFYNILNDNSRLRKTFLKLPLLYETFFSRFYGKKCLNCDLIPTEPGLCLLCGTLICIKDTCCASQDNNYEAFTHSQSCGSGTAIYQIINSGSVLIITNSRACIWASLYLDVHGEEDKDLKRGKPLYLCEERVDYLEKLYITDTLLDKIKKWTWHLNML